MREYGLKYVSFNRVEGMGVLDETKTGIAFLYEKFGKSNYIPYLCHKQSMIAV